MFSFFFAITLLFTIGSNEASRRMSIRDLAEETSQRFDEIENKLDAKFEAIKEQIRNSGGSDYDYGNSKDELTVLELADETVAHFNLLNEILEEKFQAVHEKIASVDEETKYALSEMDKKLDAILSMLNSKPQEEKPVEDFTPKSEKKFVHSFTLPREERKFNFDDAKYACEHFGGWLAYPNSNQEWNEIKKIQDDTIGSSTWVGIRRNNEDDESWRNVFDGDKMNDEINGMWDEGEPWGDYNCIGRINDEDGILGQMVNLDCDEKRYYVCEIDNTRY